MRGDVCWLVVVLSIASAGCLVEAKPNPDPEPVSTFWDAIPVEFQANTAFLYVIGDSEEAEQTWNNFKNMTHLWENVKDIDNSIPGYGQAKALIVLLNGDAKRSIEIGLADAHKSTCIVGGLILARPAGAVAGAVAADASATLVPQQPVGVVEHAVHLENKTAGQHLDAVLDLTLVATSAMIADKKGLGVTKKHRIHFTMAKNQYISPEHRSSFSESSMTSIHTPIEDNNQNQRHHRLDPQDDTEYKINESSREIRSYTFDPYDSS